MSSGEKVDAKEEEEEIYISHPQPNASLSPSPTQSPHNTDDTNNGVNVDVAPIKVDAPPPIPPITHAPSPPPSPLSTTAVDRSQDRDPPPPPTLLKDPIALHPYPHSQHLNLISQDEDSGVKSLPLKFAPSKHLSPKTMTLPLTQEPQGDENIQELKHAIKKEQPNLKSDEISLNTPTKSFFFESAPADGYESGTEEEQAAFLKDVENFYRDNNLEFKAPKFYKEELNLLKLWRAVIKLGGYEQVTSCKLWRQVGESFRPPKTCTTVSWTFRMFYEKALLEYEKNKMRTGQLPFPDPPPAESINVESQAGGSQALGSGRARRDAAARAMQGWHSQRLLGNGQVFHPIIKDKNLSAILKNDKQLKTNGLLKRKRPAAVEHAYHVAHMKTVKPQGDGMVIDIGTPADWVKINVQRTNDCFEIYALVPGLLREEVHVQSDPAGRLIISGQPEQLDNPWGVTPFKKVVSLPSRIDPHQTSAVVTLHGQLFVRVPFEQSDHH